jgi:hypothetical protein
MVILIFLGILWLKFNNGTREGNEPAAMAAVGAEIASTAMDKLKTAGVDTSQVQDQLPGLLDKISGYVNDATAEYDSAYGDTGGPPDYSTVIDTTGGKTDNTYFTGKKFSDGFCNSYTDNITLNNQCSTLTAEHCNQTSCCVLLNGEKCVAGNAKGPTFLVDENRKDIDYSYYSYKNECYGSCGKGIGNAANPCAGFGDMDTGVDERCIKRLWTNSTCPNARYINPALVSSLKNVSKAEIEVKFNEFLTDEPNYANCYGPNQSNWPVPCYNTSDTSIGLSARCMTKLFTDSGCMYPSTITDSYALANNTVPKSDLLKTFKSWTTADDDETLTKCYGPDEFTWPDPCINVPDNANMYKDEIPLRCVKKLWIDTTGCKDTTWISNLYKQIKNMTPQEKEGQVFTKKQLVDFLSSELWLTYFRSNRFMCHGPNPNNWPDGLGIKKVRKHNDPCISLKGGKKASSVSPACRERLIKEDVFPKTNCKSNLNRFNRVLEDKIADTNYAGPMLDMLMGTDSRFNQLCPVPKMTEFILGVGTNNNIYTKPASNLNEAWTDRNDGQNGRVWSFIQLNDGTFLGLFMDLSLWTKKSLESKDKWNKISRQPCCTGTVIQLKHGTFVAVGGDRKLYKRATLEDDDWSQIPNSGDVVHISLITLDGERLIVGFNIYNQVSTRPATTEQAEWTFQPKFNGVRAITQLKDGTFVAAGENRQLYTKTNIDAEWVNIPNSGDVYNVTTINILA